MRHGTRWNKGHYCTEKATAATINQSAGMVFTYALVLTCFRWSVHATSEQTIPAIG